MQIIKNKDHVLLKNEKGEYHLSNTEFNKLGEKEAIKLAEKEINLKNEKGYYPYEAINFKQARNLGFCKFGIEDFCNDLKLDINEEYKVSDLNKALTLDILKRYPNECIKLFGKNTLRYLGGIKGILSVDTVDLVLREDFIDKKTLQYLAVDFTYSVLPIFEKKFSEDKRVRNLLEVKLKHIEGLTTDEEVGAARDAGDAIGAAARDIARDAARDAAWDAERKNQVQMILQRI